MRKDLNDKIRKSGLKKWYLCQQIGITNTMLYYFLTGQRNLADDKVNKLIELLNYQSA